MTTEGPLRRYTCDRCHNSKLVREGISPDRWIGINIQSAARLGQIKHLCGDCATALDRHLFSSEVASS